MVGIVQKGNPPKNAVRLSAEEAISLQWELIYNWKPSGDIWPFRYGVISLSLATAISGIMVASHFRRRLKIRNMGNFIMYFPNVVIPTMALPLLHLKFVSEPILLQTDCPLCIQLRSIFLQNSLGLIFPFLMSSASGFLVANTYGTIRLPLFALNSLAELFGIYRSVVKPFTTRLFGLSLVHTILTIAITEAEARSLFKIQRTLIQQMKNQEELNHPQIEPSK